MRRVLARSTVTLPCAKRICARRAPGTTKGAALSCESSALFDRKVLTPLIVASALFMEAVDSTVIATSLEAIARDLHQDPLALKLALTSYLVSQAVFVPASAWMADRFGGRNIFGAALAVFVAGSILCGLSTSLLTFVGSRVVQGLGGAMTHVPMRGRDRLAPSSMHSRRCARRSMCVSGDRRASVEIDEGVTGRVGGARRAGRDRRTSPPPRRLGTETGRNIP